MSHETLSPITLTAATAAATTVAVLNAAEADDLVARIRSTDEKVRGEAWQKAGPAGAPAVAPLAGLMTDADFESARAAKRAIWNIVHYAGRPGAAAEAKAVEAALLPLLGHSAAAVRREALWMLSEIGGDAVVDPMAKLLGDAEVRDDARCSLERMPGAKSLQALQAAMGSAPEEFKYALADSLRKRGEKVQGYPTRKLTPTKATQVKPA